MECVLAVLGSIAAETARFICGSIYSNIRNALKFQSNLNAMKQNMKDLIERRDEIKEELVSANKEGKIPTRQLKEWLREVEGIEQEVNLMQAHANGHGSILCGCCLNCCLNYRVGKKLAEKLEEVNRLMKDSSFQAGMVDEDRQVKTVEYIPGPLIESQTTASKNLGIVMDLLNNDAVKRIGIWGMGGVGKTTLVKNLNNKLKSNSLQQPFDIVIWVTVSKESELKKVQTQIAERLNLDVKSEESVDRMAIKLYQRLEKEKKFLLILDDVWDTIDFDSLGVPQPEINMGSKIILTSRSSEVCRGMKVDAEVKVDVLNSEEAWKLFNTNAGTEANLEHIKPIAEAVARECSGLPLALITVGTAMRGKAMIELWKDALKKLQQSGPYIRGIENKVYKPLRWSYDSLEGNNIKPCFLYCSLFPEDFLIEVSDLVQYWLAEGLIDEHLNYEDSLNRGINIIENLKTSCLLEDGMREGTVKMHDVVRDVAIWIASSVEDGCTSIVQSGLGLSQISDAELLKSYKRISFMHNNIKTLPDCTIQCPKASTLLLQYNYPLERVPEQFLVGFQALRVLDMSRTHIRLLPLSLSKMNELRALVLRYCRLLKEVPPLGGLRKLQVLDLSYTGISELPKGMEELNNLRQLKLSFTRNLKTIQAGKVSGLSSLEVLDMTRSACRWGVKGEAEEGLITFAELGSLSRLSVVNIWLESNLPHVSSAEDVIWMKRLRSFRILVGSEIFRISLTKFDERMVIFNNLDLSEKRILCLVINATGLFLGSCRGIRWMFEDLVINTEVLAGLKFLRIESSDGLGPLSGCAAQYDLLPNLEELVLSSCNDLESVWELVGPLGIRFSRLRSIEVGLCFKLTYCIPHDLIPYLMKLEEIHVYGCSKLETLFEYNTSSSGQKLGLVVPNLRRLKLLRLPKLTSIWKEGESFMQSLEELIVIGCFQVKRLPLTSQNANTIKTISGEEQWWSNLEWDDEVTKFTLLPYFRPIFRR